MGATIETPQYSEGRIDLCAFHFKKRFYFLCEMNIKTKWLVGGGIILLPILLMETSVVRQSSGILSFLLSFATLSSSHPNICYRSEIFFVTYADNIPNTPTHAVPVSSHMPFYLAHYSTYWKQTAWNRKKKN